MIFNASKTYFLKYFREVHIFRYSYKVIYLKRLVKKRIGLGTWSWGNKLFWNYQSTNDDDLRETYNEALRRGFDPVSYTHLTLPTIRSV